MDTITCGLVEKFQDLVLDLTWEQLLYLIHYRRNIEHFNEQLKELTLRRCSIQHRIDEAENNIEQIEEEVLDWLVKVDQISDKVRKLQEKSQAKTECSITSCPNPWLRYKLSKKAKEIAQEVVEICGKGNFHRVSYRVPPPSMPELTNRDSNEGIDSRVPIMNQIMEALRNPSVNMIGLCGLGGVGKTTIAREVEKKVKNQKMFENVIMAIVSKELNVEKIQGQIADKLGMPLNERTEDVRASRLWERLKKEKNMLLILDDLWEELDLRKVGIPFVDVENYSRKDEGCKILLTSRNKSLLSDLMKCQEIIKVGVLSKNEAWELFKRIAEFSIESGNPDLKPIADEIVQKCGGLPLAIATTAKALRGKNLDEWKDYLARWKNHLRRNNTGIKEVDASLKLSYDPLSQEKKTIFLLAAMLTHDPSIEDLLMYSMGLDIFQGIENMEQAYVGISAILSKLKSLNLFLDSISSHHITIHDVFRDIALLTASDELHAFILRHKSLREWPDEDKLEGYKGICLQESDISVDLTEELHAPTLEFFLLHNTKQHDLTIPSMFFKSSKKLKLLAFTDVRFSSLPSLSFLLKLKTLCLHSCLLGDITEVARLKNLKVLSLAYSEIEWLPIQLAGLTYLQMLNLSHCSTLKVIPPKLLSSLKKLEVLYMGNSFNQWKIEGSSEANENASLQELKDLPISSLDIHIPNVSMLPEALFLDLNLKRYRIFIGEHWKWQDNYETSKILKLELEGSIHLKPGVQKLMKGAEDLYLYGSNGLENVLHCHDGRAFPHLRHLQIESNDPIRYIVLNSAHHEAATNNISNKTSELLFNKVLLPKLERLELSNSINLIPMVWDDQLSHTSFSNLKILIVKNCGFVKLVSLRVLRSLNNLEELEVRECNMLELVFDFEDLNDYKGEAESSSVIVPLKKLTLYRLRKLTSVWSNHYEGDVSFPSLRSVRVSACESLTSLFPASIAKGILCDLEYLRIEYCDMEAIVAKDQVSESVATVLEFPRLISLELSWLQNLKNVYPRRHTLEWPQLQQLDVTRCDELEIFEKEVSSSLEIHEEQSTLASKYPLLSHDKVTHNLEKLTLWGKGAEMIGSGQLSMYRFPKVKLLCLDVDYHKATTISYKLLLKSFPNLEELRLGGHIKKASGGDDVHLPIKLTLSSISKITSLVPLLVSSPNLTHLHVESCYQLTTLMTSSVARSLVHLTSLSISWCSNIKEIIWKQEGEDDDDEEVVFSKLQHLKVERLPELKRFCGYNYAFIFPLLEQVIITKCPKFKVFSPGLIDTPSLKSVLLSQDGFGKHHEIWDTNLNKTLYQQIFVASREMVLDEDDVSMIRKDQFPADSCPKVEILGIEGFDDEGATFPYTLLERFPRLTELRVKDSSFEEIFPSPVVHQIQQLHNLIVLKMFQCHQLIYLMTNSAAKSLVNLETLDIFDCEKMEKIVKNQNNDDVEGGITFSALRRLKLSRLPRLKVEEHKTDFNIEDPATNNHKVSFQKLEILELDSLNSLVPPIWDDKPSHNSFSSLKTLSVSNCDIVKLVPLHVLKYLNNLEELEVKFCDMLETVFYFEDLNDYKEIVLSPMAVPLKELRLKYLPKLKNVLAPSICHQNQIEEIIPRQEEDNEDTEIIFSKLELLELDGLPRLKRFCSQNYTFKFPLLQSVTIAKCPQLTAFCFGAIHAPQLRKVRVTSEYGESHIDILMTDLNATIQHRFTIQEVISTTESMALNAKNITIIRDVFPEVRTLYVESFKDEGVIFPCSSLEKFPKLNRLYVEHSSFEEVFPPQDEIINFRGEIPPFKELHIAYLDQLKSIWKDDSQLPPNHQDLITCLEVESCHSLFKLVPSSASFQNLQELSISGCHQLVYLVTSSTAKSLVSLEWLEINDCKKMEEIVLNESNEGVEGGITFNQLWCIKLTDMPSLKMFSSHSQTFEFLELEEIEITGCPEMKMFCSGVLETPELSRVKIEEHEMEWKDKGDLNKTVEMLSSAKDSVNI